MDAGKNVTRKEREDWAFQYVADIAETPWGHETKISILPTGTLQAQIIRAASNVHIVETVEDFREKMKDPDVFVIFLPQTTAIVRSTINTVCTVTPLNKVIIWETDDPS